MKGGLAGCHAADCFRAQRPYSVEVPDDVRAAGHKAEVAWIVRFTRAAFESEQAPPSASAASADRLVPGLIAKRKRRQLSNKLEANKKGRAGLDESTNGLHDSVYAHVRTLDSCVILTQS